jgi:hypothetical protein
MHMYFKTFVIPIVTLLVMSTGLFCGAEAKTIEAGHATVSWKGIAGTTSYVGGIIAVALYNNIQRLNLDVRTVLPFHGKRTVDLREVAFQRVRQKPHPDECDNVRNRP